MSEVPRLVKTRPTGNGRARGLVSSRASGRRVDAQTYAPPEPLREVVVAYWTGRWDLPASDPHTTRLLGDPCPHFVFEDSQSRRESRLVGVWTQLWERTLEGRGQVWGIKLRPGALRAFVDAPAARFTNDIVPLASLFGDELVDVQRDVFEARDDEVAFGRITHWLNAQRRHVDDAEIQLAVDLVERIANNPELTTVKALATDQQIHARALQRLFREYVGASPKWVIRRTRLQEVAVRIEAGETLSMAALAAELGYADQAHLARDFKHAVGKSPREFAASVET